MYYSASDFPISLWLKAVVIIVFWVGSTLALLVGLSGDGTKASDSFRIAGLGMTGITMPLWIQNVVALVANVVEGLL